MVVSLFLFVKEQSRVGEKKLVSFLDASVCEILRKLTSSKAGGVYKSGCGLNDSHKCACSES